MENLLLHIKKEGTKSVIYAVLITIIAIVLLAIPTILTYKIQT